MRILFILFFLAFKGLYACALCAAYTPSANVQLDFNTSKESITQIDVKWEFSEEFLNVLLENYDLNYNNKFDDDELVNIKYTLLDYIEPKNFLTQFQFYDLNDTIYIKEFKNPTLYTNNSQLFFEYKIILNLPIKDKTTFSIQIHDDGGFFNFKFKNDGFMTLDSNYYLALNPNLNLMFLQIHKGKIPDSMFIEKSKDTPKQSQNLLSKLNQLNNNLFTYIKDLLQKEFDIKTFLILLSISFAYGVFHASAPGHAKMLTSAYFMTHKSSFLKIFYFVLRIGIIHILSAFLLVSIGVVLLENLLKDVNNQAGYILTQITSLCIIFIALFMLSKKILHKHTHNCSCCNHNKLNEWGIILGAALVPCPGVVLLFVFAYEFSFFYAISSAVFITLGMCLVLFLFAISANKFHKSLKHQRLRLALEYLGIVVMLAFGMFLFINTRASVL
ncbi:DUF1007 family protein [Campylobacter insulaenigrae]|uniref:nickel/cobalt transporter n=1 Tax=Campylobacter insulaenigrae TaxID=260714 RepID=UPI0021534C0C|nr:DUF1007 family protein [Campylobacter insulaenigrae]MCR6575196.1 DUF1007 family protein [Campylobacter insulaenigrae]